MQPVVRTAAQPTPSLQGLTVSVEAGLPAPANAEHSLEGLMRQALEVPGAASALLEAFAKQTRALRLVQEADARGAASLPSDVRTRLADAAASTPLWLAVSGAAGVRG